MYNSFNPMDYFFESLDPQAKLKKDKVEWPVRLVYRNSWLGKLLQHIITYLGYYITIIGSRSKLSGQYRKTEKLISYYQEFYKDYLKMEEFFIPQEGYKSFNDWFTRKFKNIDLSRPLEKNKSAIASPADCKIIAFTDISTKNLIFIKEEYFNMELLLGNNKNLADYYKNGIMLICRLAPYDYHRYHYPIDCVVSPEYTIKGLYHSVNPRAYLSGQRPLTRNKRSYEILTPVGEIETLSNIQVTMIQVGATLVGSIKNNFDKYPPGTVFKKGEEMGYFQFGGSTLVLLFPRNSITLNAYLIRNSQEGYETAVKARKTIAYWN